MKWKFHFKGFLIRKPDLWELRFSNIVGFCTSWGINSTCLMFHSTAHGNIGHEYITFFFVFFREPWMVGWLLSGWSRRETEEWDDMTSIDFNRFRSSWHFRDKTMRLPLLHCSKTAMFCYCLVALLMLSPFGMSNAEPGKTRKINIFKKGSAYKNVGRSTLATNFPPSRPCVALWQEKPPSNQNWLELMRAEMTP